MPSRIPPSRVVEACDVRRLYQLVSGAQRELAPTATDAYDDRPGVVAARTLHVRPPAIVGVSEAGVFQHLRILRALRVVNAAGPENSFTTRLMTRTSRPCCTWASRNKVTAESPKAQTA